MGNEAFARTIADGMAGLSDPVRVRVLLALAATREPDWTHSGMRYADLREALGIEDGGRLNYHLDKLRDQFVTNEDGHYRLTAAGTRVVGEMYAGTFTGQHDPVEASLDYDCPDCEGPLTASVDSGIISVTCPDHGEVYDMTVPFRAVDRHTPTELYELARHHAWQYVGSVRTDVCPHCGNSFGKPSVKHVVDRSNEQAVEADAHAEFGTDSGSEVLLGFVCHGCGIAFELPIWVFALHCLPAIVFFADHGFDVRQAPLYHATDEWTADAYETENTFVVYFEMKQEELELELDQSLNVLEYERTRA